MPELAPYHFDLDDPSKEDGLKFLRGKLQTTGQIAHKDVAYKYGVIDPSAVDRIQRFTGMPGGNNLFISQGVEPEYVPHWLRHEIECCRLQSGGDHCREIEQQLLTEAPEELRPHLAGTRYKLFLDLMLYYSLDSNNPSKEGFKKGIVETFAYLSPEMRRYSKECLARELGVQMQDEQWEKKFWEALLAHMEPKNETGHKQLEEALKRLPEHFRREAEQCMCQAVFALGGD